MGRPVQTEVPTSQPHRSSVNKRRWAIVLDVERHRWVSVEALSQRFGLSTVSVRRHLEYLDRHGLVQRLRGGAQAIGRGGQSSVFQARMLRNVNVKRALGHAVARLFEPGDRLLLDVGTTVLEVARATPSRLEEGQEFSVVTRSLTIASELSQHRGIRLIVLGGMYMPDFDSFVGAQVEQVLDDLNVHKLVIGADGLIPGRGLTSDNVREAGLFQIMARRAERVIVVADSTKIGVNQLQTILPFNEINVLVTDSSAPSFFVEALRQRRIEVVTVEEQPDQTDYQPNEPDSGGPRLSSNLNRG